MLNNSVWQKHKESHITKAHVGKNINEQWDEKEKKSQVLQLRLILKIKSLSHMLIKYWEMARQV